MTRRNDSLLALAGTLAIVVVTAAAVLAFIGLRPGPPQPVAAGAAAPSPAASAAAPVAAVPSPSAVAYVGTFELMPKHGAIGSTVAAEGTGYDADTELTLAWQGFSGAWLIDDKDPANYKGREYAEELLTLGSTRTDASGAFHTTFTVPDGFGFGHDVRVVEAGVVRNQATFKVDMEVSVSATSGPLGAPIEIHAQGIGISALHSSWLLTYDNHFTGWLSAVTTRGHARFTVPATGGPGVHVLKIVHGSFTFPYLNMQQSPDPTRPTFTFLYTVTDGPPVLPPAAETQAVVAEVSPAAPSGSGPALWFDRAEATPGARVTLRGRGLPAGASLEFGWRTQIGVDTQMIGGSGESRAEADWPLGSVTADAQGAFQLPVEVPEDKGGAHVVTATRDGEALAATVLRVRPSAAAIEPAEGPVGTVITLNLSGIDDTDTGKIYMLAYDNAMLGYSCSVTSQGDITIFLPATGAPGWHFIDLYPGIYKGKDLEGVYNYRIPQLTYADDHPGERLPAFRFAFLVTS